MLLFTLTSDVVKDIVMKFCSFFKINQAMSEELI